MTAILQFALTVIYTAGFFAVAFIVILGRASIDASLIRLADTLFGGMIVILTQQSAYWFARQRNAVADEKQP